jgi:DMSO/TMAO reductase YedYZ molybdopterin-dependent catalytic subunit
LPAPVVSVGDLVIDLVPPPVKDMAIRLFGTSDKVALLAGTLLVTLGYAAAVGGLAQRKGLWFGRIGIGLFGLLGAGAALAGESGLIGVVPSLAGAGTGMLVIGWLIPSAKAPRSEGADAGRRTFVFRAASATLVGLAGAAGGRWLVRPEQPDPLATPTAVADRPLPPLPPETDLQIEGLTPFVTSNSDFYRIDTALEIPRIEIPDYILRVTGMVDRPLELTFQQLTDRPLVEADITLTCVSNEVGGKLAGNARWLGVRLDDLLEEAGIAPSADQIVGRSFDGYTCGFPVSTLDGRDALVAIAMNGEPLPLEHGFPARLIVPGLYGYVSATKWLTEIEITTFDAFDHYWVPRGYSAEAPIKTQSRIDTPGPLARIPAGSTVVAGVAWAQTRGIDAVEVRVDDGPWHTARLGAEVNDTTWRQWTITWDARPGQHSITCRAIDSTGYIQTEDRARPAPNGATGWHSLVVLVD